jgi:hypothetical protein
MNVYLTIAAVLSGIAALLHVGCIVSGASWYRFFGAGEKMAALAVSGSRFPSMVTAGIVCVLTAFSIYALSGAGLIARLPLLTPVLVVVTGVYSLRGVAGLFLIRSQAFGNSSAFWFWSSMICLVFGAVHLIGLVQIWHMV